MGDILELIKSRRTIKSFVPKFVSWENISRCLDAARHAPSAGNLQNWRFIVVFEPSQKQAIAEACYGQYDIVQAGYLIVIVGEPDKAERYYGKRGQVYTTQNCAAAAQNLCLEAHSLGLGSAWIGAFESQAIRTVLNIPAEITVEVVVAVGYAQEDPPKPPKYPLEPIVYFSNWRSRLKDPHKYLNNIAVILGRKRDAAQEAVKKAVVSAAESLTKKKDDKSSVPRRF